MSAIIEKCTARADGSPDVIAGYALSSTISNILDRRLPYLLDQRPFLQISAHALVVTWRVTSLPNGHEGKPDMTKYLPTTGGGVPQLGRRLSSWGGNKPINKSIKR
jgi:hypothetical protein